MSQFPLPFVQGSGALSCTGAVMQKKSDNPNHEPPAAEYSRESDFSTKLTIVSGPS